MLPSLRTATAGNDLRRVIKATRLPPALRRPAESSPAVIAVLRLGFALLQLLHDQLARWRLNEAARRDGALRQTHTELQTRLLLSAVALNPGEQHEQSDLRCLRLAANVSAGSDRCCCRLESVRLVGNQVRSGRPALTGPGRRLQTEESP